MNLNPSYFHARIVRLWVLLVLAVAYIGWMLLSYPLTRHARLDGGIGVLGGLYICSHPSAHFIDMLFFGSRANQNQLNGGAWLGWITINVVVFLLGCLMITIGVTRFI
jgi:hypothetical protein